MFNFLVAFIWTLWYTSHAANILFIENGVKGWLKYFCSVSTLHGLLAALAALNLPLVICVFVSKRQKGKSNGRKDPKTKEKVQYCDVRSGSHSCDVFTPIVIPIWWKRQVRNVGKSSGGIHSSCRTSSHIVEAASHPKLLLGSSAAGNNLESHRTSSPDLLALSGSQHYYKGLDNHKVFIFIFIIVVVIGFNFAFFSACCLSSRQEIERKRIQQLHQKKSATKNHLWMDVAPWCYIITGWDWSWNRSRLKIIESIPSNVQARLLMKLVRLLEWQIVWVQIGVKTCDHQVLDLSKDIRAFLWIHKCDLNYLYILAFFPFKVCDVLPNFKYIWSDSFGGSLKRSFTKVLLNLKVCDI